VLVEKQGGVLVGVACIMDLPDARKASTHHDGSNDNNNNNNNNVIVVSLVQYPGL
jgi:hypothetical protein